MDASKQNEIWLLMKGILLRQPKMLFGIIVIFLEIRANLLAHSNFSEA